MRSAAASPLPGEGRRARSTPGAASSTATRLQGGVCPPARGMCVLSVCLAERCSPCRAVSLWAHAVPAGWHWGSTLGAGGCGFPQHHRLPQQSRALQIPQVSTPCVWFLQRGLCCRLAYSRMPPFIRVCSAATGSPSLRFPGLGAAVPRRWGPFLSLFPTPWSCPASARAARFQASSRARRISQHHQQLGRVSRLTPPLPHGAKKGSGEARTQLDQPCPSAPGAGLPPASCTVPLALGTALSPSPWSSGTGERGFNLCYPSPCGVAQPACSQRAGEKKKVSDLMPHLPAAPPAWPGQQPQAEMSGADPWQWGGCGCHFGTQPLPPPSPGAPMPFPSPCLGPFGCCCPHVPPAGGCPAPPEPPLLQQRGWSCWDVVAGGDRTRPRGRTEVPISSRTPGEGEQAGCQQAPSTPQHFGCPRGQPETRLPTQPLQTCPDPRQMDPSGGSAPHHAQPPAGLVAGGLGSCRCQP